MNIILTLAGHSRRFKEKGYDKPKFLIEINSEPMINHVVKMFNIQKDNFYFVVNTEQKKEFPEIEPVLKNCVKNCFIAEVEPHEQGPVYSALQVKEINPAEPLIVSYCDFLVQWDYNQFLKEASRYDGAIPSFKGFHPASFGDTYYAYTRQNDKNELIELREKRNFTSERSEEFANTGIYYFKTKKLFDYYANLLHKDGFGRLEEGYVSLLFNHLVNDGLKVKITEVEKFICWGTPEDLEQYCYWSDIIKNNKTVDLNSEFKKKEYTYWSEFFERQN